MKRHGFLYATFAIFLLGLIGMTIVLQTTADMQDRSTTNIRIDELYFFAESVNDDIERATSIIGRRALVAATNGVVENESGLDDSAYRISEAFYNGTVDGNTSQLMTDSTFEDWIVSMEQQATGEDYDVNISTAIDEISVTPENRFALSFAVNHSFAIEDTAISTGFDEGYTMATNMVSIEGVDDALLVLKTGGRRYNQYRECSNTGASITTSGTDAEYNYTSDGTERTWASGDAFRYTGSSIPDVSEKDEQVLVTADLCNYAVDELDQFAGVVSEEPTDGTNVCGSGEEIDAYIGGIDDRTEIMNGTRLVMDQQDVWHQYIPQMIEDRCYFADPTGPSFLDRLNGSMGGSPEGIGSLLDVPDLPPDQQESNTSAVDHVYFDPESDAGQTHEIKGVSNHQEWFVLDQTHIEQWNITDLRY
ncbi:MAG: hypothetical protein MUP66_02270 [Candidatus Nanohaloarchaeota archaeon QJJ-5]|nr:hypothetical protein [Candidatus Nanohaloarchaeota archaeon QJJ-5]